MSQPVKRNAEVAFEGSHREDSHKPKKSRTQATPTHRTATLPPSKEQENEAKAPNLQPRVEYRAGHRKGQASKEESKDVLVNVSPQPNLAESIKEAELAANTPKQQKRKRGPHKDKEKTPSKRKDGVPTAKPSIPTDTPSKQELEPRPQKAEQNASISGESTQSKFVQLAQKDGLAVFSVPKENDQLALVATKKKTTHKQKPSQALAKIKRTKSGPRSSDWSLSPSKGGIFIDQDPLLTFDGKHLLLPTHSQLRVYSTETSLLIRSLQTTHSSSIISCALSLVDPAKIYVAYTNDEILLWDWTTNQKSAQATTQNRIRRVLPMSFDGEKEIILALQHVDEDKSSSVVAYAVNHTNHEYNLGTIVLQRSFRITNIASYAEGSVLIASSASKILLGYTQDFTGGGENLTYTWRELSITDSITTFDAQVRPLKAKAGRTVPIVDLVVGLKQGHIMLYQDFLFNLIGKEKKTTNEDIIPRKLHWHRTAVNTVKWSRDQQYIISGGNETVLVIWQLNTNEKQFLPHLSTSVLNLSISAKGSEYGLRLGDNSVMVLSTADLLPSTNITGPAFCEDVSSNVPMLLHPTITDRLLAAVPANVITKNRQRDTNATLLQQFDINSGLQISRQALARNVTTVKNVAPTGQAVVEPNVDHIAVSQDGKWLATVDRWTPPKADIASMYLDGDSPESRGQATETTLRFWGWHDEENIWELVTRINEPHQPGDRSVLGLVANPSKAEFATIGADSSIQIWSPKARHRNGVAVKSKTDEQLYTWSSSRSIKCGHERLRDRDHASSAALAYSDDGTTIAASWSWLTSQSRLVHLIDAASGNISLTLPDLLSPTKARLAFAGRHLLCLSDTFCVYDTLAAQTILTINLDSETLGQRHLATNKYDGTVAISISPAEKNKASKLLLLSITGQDVRPVWETTVPGLIQGMLASTTGPGYVLVDGKARISALRSTGAQKQTTLSTPLRRADPAQVSKSLDSIFGSGFQPLLTAGDEKEQNPDGFNVVTSSSLDEVLNFISSNHAPSPAELFERVVGAVGGRRGVQKSVVA